jgi:GNAT superfamily N-acetyltransferase
MLVRPASTQDLAQMVALSERKRIDYQPHSPLFWRKAEHSAQAQAGFFAHLLQQPDWLLLVHEQHGQLDGAIIGRLIQAPPVYDPGGKICLIDDFVVADPASWDSVGVALHRALQRCAAQAGAVATVTVCGAHDAPKRAALSGLGAHLASEWYVHTIASAAGSDSD